MDPEIIKDVVTATTIIFGVELVAFTIIEIFVVIVRVATIKKRIKME